MITELHLRKTADQNLFAAVDAACRAIPPAWPLAANVAVNPYLGQSGATLAQTGARLAQVAGTAITMPRDWYKTRIADGRISDEDIAAALAAASPSPPYSVKAIKVMAGRASATPQALPTIADLAAQTSGTDWPSIITERFGVWAAGYFDQGQALWAAPRDKGAWRSWRSTATHDLTPEILGLSGFAARVDDAADDAMSFIAYAVDRLALAQTARESYFHQLLMTLGGWAQIARYQEWQAKLDGQTDDTLRALLAIRLFWEVALYEQYESALTKDWSKTRDAHCADPIITDDLAVDAVLQEAAERGAQRALAAILAEPARAKPPSRPVLQVAFCIDVRSEAFRRALEIIDSSIETLGFAGFFGIGTAHKGFASDIVERRLPVLLNPAVSSDSAPAEPPEVDARTRIKARGARAWGRFKLAAVSSFAFVESAGPLYIGKLARDALCMKHGHRHCEPPPQFDPSFTVAARIDAADGILRAMGLTDDFARLVLLAGHGAHVTNNPHASTLQCGACGGYAGDVNARLLAGLLNDSHIRAALVDRGITIPADTLFVAALHDTTSDVFTIFEHDSENQTHEEDIRQAKNWLNRAGEVVRAERSTHLPRAHNDKAIRKRNRNWAETRPEWGLAGCRAFIAAPRNRTFRKNLAGYAFLHNYNRHQDKDFKVLELILTAPVVVASWISLQYYGSCVSPELFGAGNKLLHNVTGGIGVLEGNGGVLRTGLPWQSVHNGEDFMHEPLRLAVCIEAPTEAITDILRRNEAVRTLFDNRWLHLLAMDDTGALAWRYAGGLRWESFKNATSPLPAQRTAS